MCNTSQINKPSSAECRREEGTLKLCSQVLLQPHRVCRNERVSQGGCVGRCKTLPLPLWDSKCRFKNLLNRSKSRSESKLICSALNFIIQAQVFNLLNHNPLLNSQHQHTINMLSKYDIYIHNSSF